MQIYTLLLFLAVKGTAQSSTEIKTVNYGPQMHTAWIAAYKQTNPDSAILFLKQLLEMSLVVHNDSLSNCTLLKIGECYVNKGDCLRGLACTKDAFAYSAKSLINQADDYGHLGYVYFTIGDYVSATESFYASIECYKKCDPDKCASIYRFLGMINFRLHQYQKAIYYFNIGECIARKRNFQNITAIILLCKGEYYTAIANTDSAGKCYNEAIMIAGKIGRTDIKAEGYEGIGKTALESGNFRRAVHYLQIAVDIGDGSDKTIAINASYYLGDALYRLKKYKEAQAVLVPALQQATVARLNDNAIKGYTTLSSVYKAVGLYTKAIDCMDSISILKDLIESTEKEKAINLMDIKYQTAQKDRQIANSQLLIAKQNSKIARKNMWILIIGGSILLLLLVSAGLYHHSLNRQKSLDKENKISILQAAVRGGDIERRRIARELHDGIGGMLSAAMMRFSSMHHDNATIAATRGYAEAMDILHEMGDEIRKTAHNLMPEVLLKQSLPDAIRAYCDSLNNSGSLYIEFQCYGVFEDTTQEHKLNLYRIVQELIRNIISHAHATHAMVQLIQSGHALIVSVEDNGIGFNKSMVRNGQGLYNTQTRISSLDGKFTLESVPGKGTSIFIEIDTKLHKEHYQQKKT